MSLPLPVSINPKPLSVSRLIVPSAICLIPQKVSCSVARKHRVQAAPLQRRHSIEWLGYNELATRLFRIHELTDPKDQKGLSALARAVDDRLSANRQ